VCANTCTPHISIPLKSPYFLSGTSTHIDEKICSLCSDGDLKWDSIGELIKVDHLNLHFLWGCDQVMPKCKFFHTFFAAPCKLHLLLIVSNTAVPTPFFVGYWCRKWKSRIQQHHQKKRFIEILMHHCVKSCRFKMEHRRRSLFKFWCKMWKL
jgi:hypothetical protein